MDVALKNILFLIMSLAIFQLKIEATNDNSLKLLRLSRSERRFIHDFPKNEYKVYHIPNQGSFYIDDINDTIKKTLISGNAWEPYIEEIIKAHAVPGTIALDIGAHIGTHTLSLSNAVGKKGRVIAFEPQWKIFRELYKNIELNKRKNIIPAHMALGSKNTYVFLGDVERHLIDNVICLNEGGRPIQEHGKEKVKMRTLDSLNLNNISLIKIDVENMELETLKGAEKTLIRNKPKIIIEIQGNEFLTQKTGKNPEVERKKVFDFLKKIGYSLKQVSSFDYFATYTSKKHLEKNSPQPMKHS